MLAPPPSLSNDLGEGPNHMHVVSAVVVSIAFGGSPYGATKRVNGVPEWGGTTTRALQLGL